MDYDQEIERWYRPENFEPSDDDQVESLLDCEISPLRDTYFNADICQPGSFGEMMRKHMTVSDMEALCR